jgi:hypothetical protein
MSVIRKSWNMAKAIYFGTAVIIFPKVSIFLQEMGWWLISAVCMVLAAAIILGTAYLIALHRWGSTFAASLLPTLSRVLDIEIAALLKSAGTNIPSPPAFYALRSQIGFLLWTTGLLAFAPFVTFLCLFLIGHTRCQTARRRIGRLLPKARLEVIRLYRIYQRQRSPQEPPQTPDELENNPRQSPSDPSQQAAELIHDVRNDPVWHDIHPAGLFLLGRLEDISKMLARLSLRVGQAMNAMFYWAMITLMFCGIWLLVRKIM